MTISLYILISIFAALLNIVLGLIVFFRNKNKFVNISFFLMTIFISLWIVTLLLSDNVSSVPVGLFLVSLTETMGAWLAYFFVIFCFTFPDGLSVKLKKISYFLLVLPISFSLLTFFTEQIISDIQLEGNAAIPVFGPLGLFFFFGYLLGLALLGLLILFIKYRKTTGLYKLQLKFMGFGLSMTAVSLFILSIILPNLFNIWTTTNFASLSTLFFVGFTSYAVVKHRMLDIRMVVARSIAYLTLLALLATFYAGSVLVIERLFFTDSFDQINLTQGAVRTILAVIMAFSFQPLRRWITRKTDRIFFKNAYDPQKLLDDLSHLMSSTIVLDALLVKVLEILISDMKISRGIFILFKEDYSLYKTQTSGYKEEPKIDMKDAVRLARNGTAVYDELDEDSQYKEPLRKFEASISLPLKTEKEIVGVLLLGEKNSGDMFNQQDLRILEIIAPEVSVAIENAKSYEEISRFNVTLKNEVKHATKRLEEKNAQLRELDQAKDEFISMASHQLRTPLTVIKGYLSMLLEGDVGKITKSQEEFIHEAFDGSSRMVGLINDLLNVSRMDTGRFFIEPTEVDMEELVGQEVKELQKQAEDKGLYLKIEKTGKVPHVWVDETKIRQVVMNFIDNALYYTEKGGVTIKLEKVKDKVIYAVSDTGVGIPKAEQPKIFEKFFRAGNARKIRPDGTGLGIYLAKRVIEDHGGEIFFESTEGQGSTFGFRVPYRKHPMPEKDNHTPEPKILSVD